MAKNKKRPAEVIDCRTGKGRKKFAAILIDAMKFLRKKYGIRTHNYKEIIGLIKK